MMSKFQGASVGTVFGFAFGLWIAIGSYTIKKNWVYLPTTGANCTNLDPMSLVANVTSMVTYSTMQPETSSIDLGNSSDEM